MCGQVKEADIDPSGHLGLITPPHKPLRSTHGSCNYSVDDRSLFALLSELHCDATLAHTTRRRQDLSVTLRSLFWDLAYDCFTKLALHMAPVVRPRLRSGRAKRARSPVVLIQSRKRPVVIPDHPRKEGEPTLLGLPLELRRLIYDYVLDGESASRAAVLLTNDRKRRLELRNPSKGISSLLLVNRLVNVEARDHLAAQPLVIRSADWDDAEFREVDPSIKWDEDGYEIEPSPEADGLHHAGIAKMLQDARHVFFDLSYLPDEPTSRAVDLLIEAWETRCSLETVRLFNPKQQPPLRRVHMYQDGLPRAAKQCIINTLFEPLEDLWRNSGVHVGEIEDLAPRDTKLLSYVPGQQYLDEEVWEQLGYVEKNVWNASAGDWYWEDCRKCNSLHPRGLHHSYPPAASFIRIPGPERHAIVRDEYGEGYSCYPIEWHDQAGLWTLLGRVGGSIDYPIIKTEQ